MRAARDASILQYIGHSRVQLLLGGLAAWRAAGCELSARGAGEWTVRLRVREHPELVIGFDEILVKLEPKVSEADAAKLVESLGGKIMNPSMGGWLAVNLPDDKQAEEMIAAFRAKPGVVDATPHRIRSIK